MTEKVKVYRYILNLLSRTWKQQTEISHNCARNAQENTSPAASGQSSSTSQLATNITYTEKRQQQRNKIPVVWYFASI